MAIEVTGDNMAFTPAATAPVASPLDMPRCAKCPATKDEEHAVSIPIHGPINPKVYETLHCVTSHFVALCKFSITSKSKVEGVVITNQKLSACPSV